MSFLWAVTLVVLSIPSGIDRPGVQGGNASRANLPRKVWTNDDLARLHDQGLISIIGQANSQQNPPQTTDSNAPLQPAASAAPEDSSRDPQWYAKQAAKIQQQLADAQDQLRRYQNALAAVRDNRSTSGGFVLDQPDIGITPEASLDILAERVRTLQQQSDDLAEQARRNGIEPGVLERGQAPPTEAELPAPQSPQS